jgi:hypothetical protein
MQQAGEDPIESHEASVHERRIACAGKIQKAFNDEVLPA